MSEAAGIELPKGSPDALMAAVGLWGGLAEVMDSSGRAVGSATTSALVADWHGDASEAYAGRANGVSLAFAQAASSCRDAATACRR
jgi:hypothetical protein